MTGLELTSAVSTRFEVDNKTEASGLKHRAEAPATGSQKSVVNNKYCAQQVSACLRCDAGLS